LDDIHLQLHSIPDCPPFFACIYAPIMHIHINCIFSQAVYSTTLHGYPIESGLECKFLYFNFPLSFMYENIFCLAVMTTGTHTVLSLLSRYSFKYTFFNFSYIYMKCPIYSRVLLVSNIIYVASLFLWMEVSSFLSHCKSYISIVMKFIFFLLYFPHNESCKRKQQQRRHFDLY
jgi:hypothetical protein